MNVCGLTGGVGMGKSTTADFLRERSIRVVDTDQLARELVEPGQPALQEIQSAFGGQVFASDGHLNRDALAKIVFADVQARRKLEGILHPRIRESWSGQIDVWRRENVALAFVVIPLLFETNAESSFDKIFCTACSPLAQRNRLFSRGWSPSQIEQRIAAQLPTDQKIARSDFVIWTDGAVEIHRQQVDRLLMLI